MDITNTTSSTTSNDDDVIYNATKLFDTSLLSDELSLQEQLRRERMRLFTQGVSSYEIIKRTTPTTTESYRLMVPMDGQVLLYDSSIKVASERLHVVYDGTDGAAVDPHLSPDANMVAFVINDDLYTINISNDLLNKASSNTKPIRLTSNGSNPGIACGLADYIAQEEMNRFRGFWWSNDSTMLVYTENDENHIPEYTILHQGKADPKHTESHRYPFAGDANPIVKVYVIDVNDTTKTSIPMILVDDKSINDGIDPNDYYVGRVGWWPDGSVMAQIQNRDQTLLQLLRLDPKTGERTVLVEEKSDKWTNLHDLLCTFPPSYRISSSTTGTTGTTDTTDTTEGFYFIWLSERSGYSQLYLYHYNTTTGTTTSLLDGTPIGGGGEYVVESIDGVDEDGGYIYFSGNRGESTERHLFVASFLQKMEAVQVTTEPGWHVATVSTKHHVMVEVFSSLSEPSIMRFYNLSIGQEGYYSQCNAIKGTFDGRYYDGRLDQLKDLFTAPLLRKVRSHDDKVQLDCAIYRPDASIHGSGPYPTIVSVYGGPHVQRVLNQWMTTVDLRAQRFAQDGYLVLKCDNRGSYRRGIEFEGAIKWDMGNIEVIDQVTAVNAFVKEGLVDANQVGMFGWSYGGYMSAMSLCRAPDTFKCSVAGAPVTSWDGYDTCYTERYMGTPQKNVQGYIDSSVMNHVHNMKGKLMLVHGLIDENVHFRHTARLINRLIECRKYYDLILFPCERHAPHKVQDRIYMEDRIYAFFIESLQKNNTTTNNST